MRAASQTRRTLAACSSVTCSSRTGISIRSSKCATASTSGSSIASEAARGSTYTRAAARMIGTDASIRVGAAREPPVPSSPRIRRQILIACALFFLSGASALVYQVLWLRTLGWVFGVTVYAASAVWAMFMAGLALGSIGAGLAADRVRNPLRWFGVTEVLIGVTAFATPEVLGRLQQAYVSVYPS